MYFLYSYSNYYSSKQTLEIRYIEYRKYKKLFLNIPLVSRENGVPGAGELGVSVEPCA